jgi:hypothetical protein
MKKEPTPMATTDSQLRALIRLLPPARTLKDQLEKSLHLEIYAGTGDFAVSSFKGLHASISRLTDDPYVAALAVQVPEGSGDKEKVSLALLAAGQLAAYLEGETGLINLGGGKGTSIQTAPNINLNNVEGVPGIEKILNLGTKQDQAEG